MGEAIDAGADAFFDEKYGETVRTVRVDGYSHELCGGTHCPATGQVGSFVITGERSIGSGMRRIEALTGAGADAYLRARSDALAAAAEAAGAQTPEALPERIRALQDELREARRRLRTGAGGNGVAKPGELAGRAVEVAPGVKLVAYAGPYATIDEMKGAAKYLRGILGSGVIALGLDADEPQLFVTVSEDLVSRGLSAGDLVREATAAIDGRGGGRPEMAQGKGSRREALPAALELVRSRLATTS
jgi:alanyl-tRNA synthetase